VIRPSIINRDIKALDLRYTAPRKRLNPAYLLSTTAAAIIIATLLSLDPEPAQATRHSPLVIPGQSGSSPAEVVTSTPPLATEPGIPAETAETAQVVETAEAAEVMEAGEPPLPAVVTVTGEPWQEVTVKSGDSLAAIFKRLDISPQELHNLLELGGATQNLRKIYPGQVLRVVTGPDQQLLRLSYPIDQLNTLEVSRNEAGFDVSTVTVTPEFRTKTASGTIDSSLFLAGNKAGLSDSLTMELAGMFGWDIDFVLDIREGDRFTVLYEEMYVEGENIGNGTILAAEFVNQGNRYQAVRYTDAGGKTDYYSLDGKSMRKAFLRTPVEFSRISSGFSLGRKHPILNKIRAHKGVDYAAATGTPIKATGDGKIVHRGTKGGYGNTVIIQHGTKYSTLYAHMSKFRGGLGVGSRVKQGQVIGYIGSSGLATGPHLHYEFQVDGVHRDPLRVKLPGAEPLQAKYLEDFNNKAEILLAKLDMVRDIQVASNH
jgi:murein DD-endopeptidase MepM/ murein hydrolase activator NlpD